MVLEKLTQKATLVLSALPKNKRVSVDTVKKEIEDASGMGKVLIHSISKISSRVKSIDTEALIKEAYYQSVKFEHPYVGTEHILLALLKLTKSPNLEKVGLELMKMNVFPNEMKFFEAKNRTPILDSFGGVLSKKILKESEKEIVSRDSYNTLISSLLLKESSGVLLVGERGVGRRTTIQLLAKNTSILDVPPALVGYQVVEFDLLSFMTSVFSKGGFELGLFALLDELKSLGRVILYIKNFENIFLATSSGLTVPMFYSMFKNAVNDADIKLVSTLDTSLYEKITSDNDHVLEGFTVVEVEEPSEKETLKILQNEARSLGEFHNVIISEDVVIHAYGKAKDELGDLKFPKKGVDLLDHACVHLIFKKSKIPESYKKLVDRSFDLLMNVDSLLDKGKYDRASEGRISLKTIEKKLSQKEEDIFFNSKKLKLTISDINSSFDSLNIGKGDEKRNTISKLSNLSNKIKKDIIGQDEAVDKTVKALIRAELGLRTRKRPLGNFLFLGPTGVGKTELAKVMAESFYGDSNLIRLDMSDFSEKHTVARLVGAPPGYIGYGEGGELTSRIQSNPNSVVLFDEIEKAHPDVLNILLQIMEEAELKDARGHSFDFSSSVIVLTSNLGTDILQGNGIGFESEKMSDKQVEGRLRNNLKKILKPELLNRFDEIIIFKRLSKGDQYKVLDLLIGEVRKALKKQNINIFVGKKVKDFLVKEGYSEEYGARALRRTVETLLLDKIAEFLLENKKRPLSLKVSVYKDSIKIERNSNAKV